VVSFSHCYPSLIYYLTERSLFEKSPPTGKSLKKALRYAVIITMVNKYLDIVSHVFIAFLKTENSSNRVTPFELLTLLAPKHQIDYPTYFHSPPHIRLTMDCAGMIVDAATPT
jgi:hypothetical protein